MSTSTHDDVRDALDAPDHGPAAGRDGDTAPSQQAADAGEDGSVITEYGLLAVVAATVAAAVINWASEGALITFFNALMRQARDIVGA